jgi:hypothetical protein
MKKTLFIAALLIVTVAIGFAVRAQRACARAEEELAHFAEKRVALQRSASEFEYRMRDARVILAERARTAAQRNATFSVTHIAPGSPSATAKSLPAAKKNPTPHTIIANDPKQLAAYLADFRSSLDFSYGSIFKQLSLSPDQITRFKDVETSLEQWRMDLDAASETQGLDPKSSEYQKMWADYRNARTVRKRDVLGDLTEAYLVIYRSQNVRELAARALVPPIPQVGEPVTAIQVEKAGAILAANSRRDGGGWVTSNTINWDAAKAQLHDVLSPAQIVTLGNLVRAEKATADTNARTNRLRNQFNTQGRPK